MRLDQFAVSRDDPRLVLTLRLWPERVEALVEDPRATQRPAPDHHRVAARLGHHPACLGHRAHVAVARHREADDLRHLSDDGPRRLAGEALRARAWVHRDGVHALAFGHLGHLDRVEMLVVPAAANLDRERHGERLAQGAQDERGARHIPHERGALALGGDLGHGTAHVEVHDVGAERLAALRGAHQELGVLAQELHGQRALLGVVGGDRVGMRMVHQQRRGVHLFRGGQAAAALPRDEPEGRIGDAGHGSQPGRRLDLDSADLHGSRRALRPGSPSIRRPR